MKLLFELIDIAQMQNDLMNYNTMIFKVEVGKTIDIDNTKTLRVLLQTMINGGAKKILLDMKGLEYIDSGGIGLLINTAKNIRTKEGDIVLTNVTPEIKIIFNIISLQDFIKVFNLEVEAVEFFRYL